MQKFIVTKSLNRLYPPPDSHRAAQPARICSETQVPHSDSSVPRSGLPSSTAGTGRGASAEKAARLEQREDGSIRNGAMPQPGAGVPKPVSGAVYLLAKKYDGAHESAHAASHPLPGWNAGAQAEEDVCAAGAADSSVLSHEPDNGNAARFSVAGPDSELASSQPDASSRKEFSRIARRAGLDVPLLESLLAMACRRRQTLTLSLGDFPVSMRAHVVKCIVRNQDWRSLMIDMGVRSRGWEQCLPALHEAMTLVLQEPQRRVQLDFGLGSLASASAPAILQKHPEFLHGFEALTFQSMDIRGPAQQALMQVLTRADTTLSKLTLMQTYLSGGDIAALMHALQKNTMLTQFRLGCFPISKRGMAALASLLMVKPDITDLALPAIRPDKPDTALLIKSLAGMQGLKTLDISGNNIDQEDLCDLAAWLAGQASADAVVPALTELTMADMRCHGNQYEDDYRSYALLTELRPGQGQDNPWTVTACKALAAMLETNPNLRRLDLNDNPLPAEGLTAMLAGLEKNDTLEALHVNRTRLSLAAAGNLQALMQQRDRPLLLELNLRESGRDALELVSRIQAQYPALQLQW